MLFELYPTDVLLGRGQKGVKSPGNQQLKRPLLQYRDSYEAMPRHAKWAIIRVIQWELLEPDCRFLLPQSKDENLGWIEADEAMVR